MGVSLRACARMRGCSLTAVPEGDLQQADHDARGRDHRSRTRQPGHTFAGQTIHKASAASSDRLPPVHESTVGVGDPVTAYLIHLGSTVAPAATRSLTTS